MRDAADQLGGLDVAVVNAGIGGMSPILDLTHRGVGPRDAREPARRVRDAARVRAGDGRARAAGRDRRGHERVGLPHRPVDGALLGVEGRASPRSCASRRASSGRTASGSTASRRARPTRRCSRRPTRMRGYRERVAEPVGARPGRLRGRGRAGDRRAVHARLGHRARSSRPTAACRSRARSTRRTATRDGRERVTIEARRLRLRRPVLDTERPDLRGVVRGVRGARRGAADDRGVGGRDRDRRRARPARRGSSSGRPARSTSTRCTTSRRAHRDALLARAAGRGPGWRPGSPKPTPPGCGVAIASSSRGRLGRCRSSSGSGCTRPLRARRDRRRRRCAAKPAPDTYLEACARLGVEPRDALAVEDSPHGIAAAKAAGLRCVTVPHALTETLDLSAADLRLASLADCTARRSVVAQLGYATSSDRPRGALPCQLVERPRHLVLVVRRRRATAARRRDRAGPRARR